MNHHVGSSFKDNRAALVLGVNNPPSSAGGTGPTPLGNTRGPGASKPTGPSTEPGLTAREPQLLRSRAWSPSSAPRGAPAGEARAPSQEGLRHGSCRKGSAARRPGTAKINTYNYLKKIQNNLTCASDPHHSQPSHGPQENFQVKSLILHMGPRGSGTSEPL